MWLPLSTSPAVHRTEAFACPTCGGDRIAQVRGSRRWVRVGTMAVLPWRRASADVRCTECGTAHPLGVLDRLTSTELATHLVDVVRVATAMVVRTGDPSHPDLRRRAVQHVRTYVPTYHQNQLDRDMATFDPATIAGQVAPLEPELATEGKERLVAGMVHVALAAHTITSHQRWLLDAAGTGLGLTPVHVTGIISDVAAAREPVADDPVDQA